MLNPLWLKTFCTLADIGHFTKTADSLYMTQPGVSQHIKKLEHACGYELLKRDGKSVELTERGRLVYDYAKQQQVHANKLTETLAFDDPHKGACKFSCSGALSLRLYPEFIKLQKQHSGLMTQLEVAPNHNILTALQDSSIDLGIVTHIPTPSLFSFEEIGQETLCLVLPEQYRDRAITQETLAECGLIHHPDAEHCLTLYLDSCGDKALQELDVEKLPITSKINQLSQILLPISMGVGFTVLPKSAVDLFPHKNKLHIHTPAKTVTENLYLVRKRNRQLPVRYDTLISKIKTLISNKSDT